ncbi:MAG: hydroxyacid dehydrogenase [Saprospiraceae bacterium]|nr:hydroxyacid dehydrogenase [Saprospiraceae bacterium]
MSTYRVLVTDRVHPLLLSGLGSRGFAVDYQPDIRLEEVIDQVPDYSGLVINTKVKAYTPLLDRAKNLRWIARLGSGMEIVDIPAAEARGIRLISTPEANCQAVAEHALGMLLCLFRNLCRADRQVRTQQWQREANRGIELGGMTVGIIGYGHTGPAFGRLLEGANVKVLVFDKYKQHLKLPSRYLQVPDLESIQREAGIISLHLPLNPETKYLINADFIQACRNPFFLINTSRGTMVNTRDLIDGLRSGKVRGACLDVFENEHPERFTAEEARCYDALYRFEQVVVSPHIAGWTHESLQRIAEVLLEKLDRMAGELKY